MKVLVTGGLGFQGVHLTKCLVKSGHSVLILSKNLASKLDHFSTFEVGNTSLSFIEGDVTDFDLVDRAVESVDVVFHLASKGNVRESLVNPKLYFHVNVDGTLAVLEAVRKHKKRLIYTSSCAVYGDGSSLKNGESFTEESPLLPIDPYGASKVAADRLCHAYHKSYGLDITTIRPFSTYGPGQKGWPLGGLIAILVEKAAKGENLTVFGDGSAVRDFLYVSDLIDAYMLILDSKNLAGEVFNVGSAVETTVYDVAKYIANKFKVKIEYLQANPNEVKRYAADTAKIRALGFKTNFNIESGIESYIKSIS